jgi:hypothetical protein
LWNITSVAYKNKAVYESANRHIATEMQKSELGVSKDVANKIKDRGQCITKSLTLS